MKSFLVALVIACVNLGCTFHCDELSEPLPASNTHKLPPLAAEFVTTVSGGDPAKTIARLVRSADAVEWRYLANNTGELWTKTSKDLWFYHKIFHADRQVIEYSPVDINLLGMHQQWQYFAINPNLLQALTYSKTAENFHGFLAIIYSGEKSGIHYEVLWLPQLSLAARISATQANQKTITEIRTLHVNQHAPFTFSDITGYRTIEYTDLGDMERDPFVMKIQHELLDHHGHLH